MPARLQSVADGDRHFPTATYYLGFDEMGFSCLLRCITHDEISVCRPPGTEMRILLLTVNILHYYDLRRLQFASTHPQHRHSTKRQPSTAPAPTDAHDVAVASARKTRFHEGSAEPDSPGQFKPDYMADPPPERENALRSAAKVLFAPV